MYTCMYVCLNVCMYVCTYYTYSTYVYVSVAVTICIAAGHRIAAVPALLVVVRGQGGILRVGHRDLVYI